MRKKQEKKLDNETEFALAMMEIWEDIRRLVFKLSFIENEIIRRTNDSKNRQLDRAK